MSFCLFSNSYSQINKESVELIDSIIKSFYDNKLFHGHVLIAKNDSIIFQKGYGYADIENKILFSSDTKLKIGSVSKQFTAHLILQLVDRGLINLNQTINDFSIDSCLEKYGAVTIQQLLIMSSGIPDYDLPDDDLKEYHDALYYLKHLKNKNFLYKPGASYNYSNPNYDILGLIVEKVTGLSIEQAYRNMIFDKIGMYDSGLNFLPDSITNKAKSYVISPTGYKKGFEEDLYLVRGCGSIYSTPNDLLRWDNSLLNRKILSNKSFVNYFYPYNRIDSNIYYSNGWIIEHDYSYPDDSLIIARHEGSAPALFNCINYIDLKNQYIIVLTDNTIYSFRREVLSQIKNILYSREYSYSKKSLYFETVKMIDSIGFDNTVKYLLNIDLRNNPYQWGRYDMDYLKGYYKRQDKIKEYLELQRVCMHLYPDFKEFSNWAINNFKNLIEVDSENSKLYAYLGAYQLFSGDKKNAEKNLLISLEKGIHPEYENYIKTLINECKN